MKLVWDDFIRGGFFTAISASALILSIAKILGWMIEWHFLLLVLLISIIIYFSNFIGELKEDFLDATDEYRVMRKRKPVLLIFVVLLTTTCLVLSMIWANYLSTIFIVCFLALGILYTLGIKKLTKRVIGFKDFYVTICWNLIILFYLLFYQYSLTTSVIIIIFLVLTRDFINVCFCDIKDIVTDRKNGLLTLANILGKKKLLLYLQLLNVISILIVFFGVYANYLPNTTLILIIAFVLTAIFIKIADLRKNFSTATVDAEYTIWIILMLVVSK